MADATSTDEPTTDAPPAEPPTLYGALRADTHGQVVVHTTRDQYVKVVKAALDDGYEMCIDLTAVDYLAHPGARRARRASSPSASSWSSTCCR